MYRQLERTNSELKALIEDVTEPLSESDRDELLKVISDNLRVIEQEQRQLREIELLILQMQPPLSQSAVDDDEKEEGLLL